jgi:hypothetical protein
MSQLSLSQGHRQMPYTVTAHTVTGQSWAVSYDRREDALTYAWSVRQGAYVTEVVTRCGETVIHHYRR